jgi:hypothetical protein
MRPGAPLYPLAFPDRVERMSDAYHLDVCGDDVVVGHLLEIVHSR